jgi:hypothetical protein
VFIIPARVIAVLVRVQNVLDRLVTDGLHLGQDLRPVLIEFVIHQQNALGGRQDGNITAVAGHDDPEIVGHLLDVERLLRRLPLRPNQA